MSLNLAEIVRLRRRLTWRIVPLVVLLCVDARTVETP